MSIAKEWESYRDGVLSGVVADGIIELCRMAFYAGALAHHAILFDPAQENISDEELIKMQSDLHGEFAAFHREKIESVERFVKKGSGVPN